MTRRRFRMKGNDMEFLMRRTFGWCILSLVMCFTSVPVARIRAAEPPLLVPERTVQSRVRFGDRNWTTFRVRVPDDAVYCELRLDGARADLDLFMQHESPIEDWGLADHQGEAFDHNEVLRVSRWDHPPLLPGEYYVDVMLPANQVPRVDGRRSPTIPFSITYHVVRAGEPTPLSFTNPVLVETSRETGYLHHYVVEVPENAECLRFDLDQSTGVFDLYARHGRPVLEPEDADAVSNGNESRKSLVIDGSSDPPLRSGTYHITVLEAFQALPRAQCLMYASLTADVPEPLLKIPLFGEAKNELQRALFATVQVYLPNGFGSGTLLTPDGLILTNFHVIEHPEGGPWDERQAIVAVNLDSRRPARELFRADVLRHDEENDLALLEIASGIYEQPLPKDFRFPTHRLGNDDALAVGSPIHVVGYPGIGGTTDSGFITLTRGVVSGFDFDGYGSLIKTDADTFAGHSGGAGLNTDYELVGVPSWTMSEDAGSGHLGYLIPVSRIPDEWRQLIESRAE